MWETAQALVPTHLAYIQPPFREITVHPSHVIQDLSNKRDVCLCLPTRISQRWCKSNYTGLRFYIAKALVIANISWEEFKKSWRLVHPMIPEEELFCLFKKAFGSRNNVPGRVAFIKDIMRRYNDMGEPVCDCLVCITFASVCSVGPPYSVVMPTCYVWFALASFIALSQYTMSETQYLTELI